MAIPNGTMNFIKLWVRENIWIQKNPFGSRLPDIQIARMETNDPANVFKELATFNYSWAKYRKFAKAAYRKDFSGSS
jgi:hypothetical protein